MGMSSDKSDQENSFGAAPHERPVPRITIHAFCEFPDTGAALQRAGSDRRLSKAHLTTQLGGVQGAIDFYSGQITPNLLIVETRLQGNEALAELDRLAEVCDADTKVIVVGRVNDVELYRELMRRGASEYLVAPLNPLRITEVISSLYLDPKAAPIGRVISFVGARGGAGSSTLAHNAGWAVAELLKINTTLIDLDLPFGTAGLDFNEDSGQGVAEALTAPERLDDMLLDRLLVKATERLSLFTTPAQLDRDYDAQTSAYESVIEAVRQTTPCVIVDIPHLWTRWVRETLLSSDEIVIISTPDLPGLRTTKNLLDLLKQKRPHDEAPKVVLNQTGIPKRPEIPARDFADSIGIAPSLVLPFDPAVFGAAANNGQMLLEVQSKGPLADGMRRLAELITGRTPQAEQPKSAIPFLDQFLKGRKQA